jgi:hypothetical protein
LITLKHFPDILFSKNICHSNTWKLQVNIAKTNVVIFSKSKVTQNTRVMSDNKELDICESYNYLGILVCIPLTFSDIRTVSSAYNKRNI